MQPSDLKKGCLKPTYKTTARVHKHLCNGTSDSKPYSNWHTALVTSSPSLLYSEKCFLPRSSCKSHKRNKSAHICSNYIANNTSTSSTISCTLIFLCISCSTKCVRWTGSLCSSKFNCGSIMHEPTGFDWSRTTERADDEKTDHNTFAQHKLWLHA